MIQHGICRQGTHRSSALTASTRLVSRETSPTCCSCPCSVGVCGSLSRARVLSFPSPSTHLHNDDHPIHNPPSCFGRHDVDYQVGLSPDQLKEIIPKVPLLRAAWTVQLKCVLVVRWVGGSLCHQGDQRHHRCGGQPQGLLLDPLIPPAADNKCVDRSLVVLEWVWTTSISLPLRRMACW